MPSRYPKEAVLRDGRRITFRAWPYLNVLSSVWEFLRRQGVSWVFPGVHGEVVPVGEGVDRFQVGDEVLGVAPYSFASHAVSAEYALVCKPKSISDDKA